MAPLSADPGPMIFGAIRIGEPLHQRAGLRRIAKFPKDASHAPTTIFDSVRFRPSFWRCSALPPRRAQRRDRLGRRRGNVPKQESDGGVPR